MREWRNWQRRTFEGRVVYTVRVQVPFPAPQKDTFRCPFCFCLILNQPMLNLLWRTIFSRKTVQASVSRRCGCFSMIFISATCAKDLN